MSELIRRRYCERQEQIHYGDVHIGTMAIRRHPA
jgi:hypothetical protein